MKAPRQAAFLAFALIAITMGVNLHVPLYPAIAAQDGHGLAATTIAFSFYVAGIVPVLLLLGGLSDRIGHKPVILVALALSGAATLMMAFSPHIITLALARLLLGVGTALMSSTALAYMSDILSGTFEAGAANWVAASTSLGFGLGPFMTMLTLNGGASLTPPSYAIHIAAVALAGLFLPVKQLCRPQSTMPMIRLPSYPPGTLWFGIAIALAWATTGLIISILPAVLAQHGLAKWSGATTMMAISCGLLFQPAARRCQPVRAVSIGLLTLLPAFAILAFGALHGQLALVLAGALLASSACYGFVYLGGLAGVAGLAGDNKARVSAGFFILAYVGYSVPVVFAGVLADTYGKEAAMTAFGVFLTLGAGALLWWRRTGSAALTSSAADATSAR
ncbi:MFS family permease [Oxalobacteraceae bacterium GrIS 1.11]